MYGRYLYIHLPPSGFESTSKSYLLGIFIIVHLGESLLSLHLLSIEILCESYIRSLLGSPFMLMREG